MFTTTGLPNNSQLLNELWCEMDDLVYAQHNNGISLISSDWDPTSFILNDLEVHWKSGSEMWSYKTGA